VDRAGLTRALLDEIPGQLLGYMQLRKLNPKSGFPTRSNSHLVRRRPSMASD
jgi:hypothetical protein